MPVLFAVTLFVSASLLFMVQPMVGRMILPLLGGSPAAWNTCMVFFQMMLLLGYLYAHKVTTRLTPARQVGLHLAVLLGAAGVMGIAALLSDKHSPIAVLKTLAPQDTAYPMFGVLALLFVAIGVPFFAVSTSAPLLQRWFAYTGHPASRDPYFLYAASNAGSLISLLGYPLVTEPSLRLIEQAWVWAAGFLVLAVLTFVCGTKVYKPGTTAGPVKEIAPAADVPPPTWPRKLKWTALAFVPSSLMLGVTFHMTTDIASVPLLWVGPLALYLLTFIIAFARTPSWFRPVLGNIAPVLTLLLVFVMTSQQSLGTFWLLGLHLLTYFFTALMCHTELAHDRPPPQHLTNYFLWISVGGMLGGTFNALIAPVLFPLAFEYPIAIAVGCMLVPNLLGEEIAKAGGPAGRRGNKFLSRILAFPPVAVLASLFRAVGRIKHLSRILDFVLPLVMIGVAYGLGHLWQFHTFNSAAQWTADQLTAMFQFSGLKIEILSVKVKDIIYYAVPAMACFFFIDRPIRFGLCVAAILGVHQFNKNHDDDIMHTERSFFGILKVEDSGMSRRLVHGTTLHGTQITEPGVFDKSYKRFYVDALEAITMGGAVSGYSLREEPLTYYHRTGPVGSMFEILEASHPNAAFGMVGLGTGSVSCYAKRGQNLTFFEIDPTVKKLVADTDKYFTYVADARARGANVEIVIGDARLKLEEQTDRKYQLLLIDAFSSDSIPVHLLTKEAVAMYMDRVPADGVVALHISNKFVKLDLVAARIAEELKLSALVMNDSWSDGASNVPLGKTQSSWVVLARNADTLKPYLKSGPTNHADSVWKEMKTDPAVKAWTDDYSDVLSVMMIRQVQRLRQAFGMTVVKSLVKDDDE